MGNNWSNWVANYDEKALKILKKIKLSDQQQNELNECMKIVNPNAKDIFEDIYKLYKSGMTCPQLVKYYNRSLESIQVLFRSLGIQRSLSETQTIAAKKRDYSKIRKTYKKTVKERFVKTQLFGSDIENLVRVEINQCLNSILDSSYEVIVGINSVLDCGELDIPIIIIHKEKFYKFGIEVGNHYMHNKRAKEFIIQIINKLNDEYMYIFYWVIIAYGIIGIINVFNSAKFEYYLMAKNIIYEIEKKEKEESKQLILELKEIHSLLNCNNEDKAIIKKACNKIISDIF